MVTPATATRVREQIVRLGARGLPVAEYSRAVGQLLTKVVPAEGTCLMTVDPATLLPTAEYVENGMPAPALLRMVDIELREPDFNKWVTLSQAGHGQRASATPPGASSTLAGGSARSVAPVDSPTSSAACLPPARAHGVS